jgi:hypothetical protein
MNDLNPENFFANTGGQGAPSAQLHDVNDFVYGQILDQAIVPKKKFGTDIIEKDDKTGEELKQLMVIVQTDQRGWAGVSKTPTYPTGHARQGQPKDAQEDDGRRAVYISPWTNLHAAIGKATDNQSLLNGATIGIKIVALEPTNKGNPKRVFEAVYQPPAAGQGFFENQQQAAPAQPAQQAQAPAQQAPAQQAPAPAAPPAQQDPWAASAPAPAQGDPWAAQGAPQQGQASGPPF